MIIESTNKQDYLIYDVRVGGVIEITDITVNTEKRKGIGTKLIECLININKDKEPYTLFALCPIYNQDALKFFKAVGFESQVVLVNFYRTESGEFEDLVVLRKLVQ